jgi:acetyl esterase/lipase
VDLYCRRDLPSHAPILIHLHGGHFRTGRKSFYARALLHEFARQGWVCISANYRLHPAAALGDSMVDVKKVIA